MVKMLVLAHYNLVNNDYQQDYRILYTFVPLELEGKINITLIIK